jgi:hypothetical protein
MSKTKWMVCPVCEGEGKTINPAIDCNGLTAQDFAEDPNFAEDYWGGAYDIICRGCKGQRVVTKERIEELQQNAEDRKLAALEDGDYEAYQGCRDWRYG